MPVFGPSGGTGGYEFNDEPDLQANTRVVRVVVVGVPSDVTPRPHLTHDVVHAVQIFHERSDGSLVNLPPHGAFDLEQQILDLSRGEHITKMAGKYKQFVSSITLTTSAGRSLAVGGPDGVADFLYEAPSGFEIVGFVGRAGALIDAIGIVLRAI